jgi:hypothetical protein
MVLRQLRSRMRCRLGQGLLVTWLAALLVPGNAALLAQEKAKTPERPAATPATTVPAATEPEAPKIPPEQLDSLVAPIALYPDNLLAQVLAASTYPLELIQLQQWLAKNPNLKDKALADAVAKQPWDPSIQTMAAVPEVVKRLADDIQWTTDLGNAFLAQQSDVMDAVQRMRGKAKEKGALESNDKQTVETKVVEEKTVIIVESANPEVIYVPSYSPTVVYGAPYYPYPPIYYPPYPPGGAFISFGVGMWMGAAIWGGSCCGCGWGHNDVNINVNNNFNRNNINNGNIGRGSGNNWSHNSQHRGGTPYSNKATANKYGGSARGDSLSSRQAKAGQQGSRSQAGAGNRAASPSTANRSGSPSTGNRAAGGGASPSTANRGGTGSAASRGGGDSIGSRSIPKSSGSSYGGGSGFSGGSRGYSGSSARSMSSRGASSMGGRGGGGRGGGGRR